MKELRLNRINRGESQETFLDKINQNFYTIEDFFGGPSGRSGNIGITGIIGARGKRGTIGFRGKRGSIWIFSPIPPENNILDGDYWIDVSNSNMVYTLIDSEWVYKNFKLKSEEQFRRIYDIEGSQDKDGIIQSGSNPAINTLVFNSTLPDPNKLNPQYSRFLLETSPKNITDFDQSQQPLIEFSKTNSGSTGDSDKSPIFRWGDGISTNEKYDLVLDIRRGGAEWQIGKNLKMYSNNSKVKMESERGSIIISSNGMSINTSKDVIMTHNPGSISPDKEPIKITSSNFSLGQGLGQDIGILNSPVEVYGNVEGYDKFAFTVKNYIEKRGDGIHINVNYNSKNGDLWNSRLNDISLLKLNKEGEMKILRKLGTSKKKSSAGTETHGLFGGKTYNWHGIYPSTSDSFSSYGKVVWDGEENIIISSSNPKRALYINVRDLSKYYIGKEKSLSFSVRNGESGETFEAIGIGGGTGPNDHYPKSNPDQFQDLSGGATSIDIHIVNNERRTANTNAFPPYMWNTKEYCLYYEAYGITGGTQTGILIYEHGI